MALQAIPTQEELILYEILRHPVFSWEFINSIDKPEYEDDFEYTHYQKEFVCDFSSYICLCCGRAVGKTEALKGLFTWLLINNIFPGDYIVYTVPNKAQLEPVWQGITIAFRSNSILKQFILPRKGINSGTFKITLVNEAVLMCRIAGTTGDGRNVIGLHTPFEIVDEGGYYPWGTWLELQPTLNTWTPGFRQMVSGVPTGFRENNVLYHCDMENGNFTKHRVSAHENPRYTEEDELRSIELYGAKDSDNYIHFVLGRHGRPVFAVFDRGFFDIKDYPVWKLTLDGIKLHDNLPSYFEKISAYPGLGRETKTIMGIDLGYTDPTAIIIMYLDRNGRFKFHGRIQLNKVPYPIQTQVIDMLDTKFDPVFIGIDAGHSGKAEIQKLQMDTRYKKKNYSERVVPIEFTSNVVIGIDTDGNEIKQKTRPFSVSILQEYSNEQKIVYSSTDPELISELERMVYVKTPSGNRVYRTMTPKGGKKGDDHFTSAMLCLFMAWYLKNETLLKPEKPKLFAGLWNV